MLAAAHSAAVLGIDDIDVTVEVHVANGLPQWTMVGMKPLSTAIVRTVSAHDRAPSTMFTSEAPRLNVRGEPRVQSLHRKRKDWDVSAAEVPPSGGYEAMRHERRPRLTGVGILQTVDFAPSLISLNTSVALGCHHGLLRDARESD